ncbi:hypothetical protein ACJDU8_14965 [Clostridium sp. WILCCON 0269]|uniref:Uncharacterized protein n=1 Tax=Candidatus Clostridium eludens TaxID=3381663 RepID=A0ABW8SLC4_9CLOT
MKDNKDNSANLVVLNNNLDKVEEILQDLLIFSLEEIKDNPSSEERIVTLWCNSIKNFNDFFFQEFERTNNKKLYKRIIRLLMFKR